MAEIKAHRKTDEYYFKSQETDKFTDKHYIVDEEFIYSKINPEYLYNNWMNMRYEYIKVHPEEMGYNYLMSHGLMLMELYACRFAIMLRYQSIIKAYRINNGENEMYKKITVNGKADYDNFACAADGEAYANEIIYNDFICRTEMFYPDFEKLYNMTSEEAHKFMEKYERNLITV